MAVTIEQIKTLRERTGAGMTDCKKALEATDGNVDQACDWLREKGILKAAKKADRIAAEGLTSIAVSQNFAAVCEINSETDFVAKNEKFVDLVKNVASILLANKPSSLESALQVVTSEGTLSDVLASATATIGERISLRRFEIVEKPSTAVFGSYLHMGGKIAALTVIDQVTEEVAKDVAMHVAASNPQHLSMNDIPTEYFEKERHIQLEAAKTDEKLIGKPEAALAKIIDGKVNKGAKEIVLAEQPFVKDPSVNVATFVANHGGKIISFVRYQVGEGMQKREDNFADEVMNQIKK